MCVIKKGNDIFTYLYKLLSKPSGRSLSNYLYVEPGTPYQKRKSLYTNSRSNSGNSVENSDLHNTVLRKCNFNVGDYCMVAHVLPKSSFGGSPGQVCTLT